VFNAAMNLLENYGYGAGTSSLAGTPRKAKFNLALSEMADMLSTFRRSASRPAHEQADGRGRGARDAGRGHRQRRKRKAMAESAGKVFERLRTNSTRPAATSASWKAATCRNSTIRARCSMPGFRAGATTSCPSSTSTA
jgi:hypothetical protein